ncbi:hypothetical protein MHYP_G00150230 [Metynnis hypsauchen]
MPKLPAVTAEESERAPDEIPDLPWLKVAADIFEIKDPNGSCSLDLLPVQSSSRLHLQLFVQHYHSCRRDKHTTTTEEQDLFQCCRLATQYAWRQHRGDNLP